jgi:hypothetical protein
VPAWPQENGAAPAADNFCAHTFAYRRRQAPEEHSMSRANTVSEHDLREIVGLKASVLCRSMLDALDRADPQAPSLHRAPVPALAQMQLPALADPPDADNDGQAAEDEDSGDPDPGTLRNDDGASLHFLAPRPAWWSFNLATCW